MLGLSMTEVIIILGLALILLGPDQLPTIAKSIGKGMREIRKATDDLKSTFEQEMVRLDEPLEAPPRALSPVAPVAPAADGTVPRGPDRAAPCARPACRPGLCRGGCRARGRASPRRLLHGSAFAVRAAAGPAPPRSARWHHRPGRSRSGRVAHARRAVRFSP